MPRVTELGIRWYDVFFISMLISSIGAVCVRWHKYWICEDPLNVWIVVDYLTILTFRCFMFIDSGVSSSLDRAVSRQDRWRLFKWRLFVLIPSAFLLYPFLWFWTITGSMWFTRSSSCLPETGQSWGFFFWIAFCYISLPALTALVVLKWAKKRKLYQQLMRGGNFRLSEIQIAFEMLCDPSFPLRFPNHSSLPPSSLYVPGTESTESTDGTDGSTDGTANLSHYDSAWYFPMARCTPEQQVMIETAIQELPKYSLKKLSLSFTSCSICLEDFDTETEVRPLPCAHVFHVKCINSWLRLNVRCPQCRSEVFPNLGLPSQDQPSQGNVASNASTNSNNTTNSANNRNNASNNSHNTTDNTNSGNNRNNTSNNSHDTTNNTNNGNNIINNNINTSIPNNSNSNSEVSATNGVEARNSPQLDNTLPIIAPLNRQNIITIPRISIPMIPNFPNVLNSNLSRASNVISGNRTVSMSSHPLLDRLTNREELGNSNSGVEGNNSINHQTIINVVRGTP